MESISGDEIIRGSLTAENVARLKKIRDELVQELDRVDDDIRTSYAVEATLAHLSKDLERRLLANGFSKASRSASNLPWSINSLPEEYRAHCLDQRNAMREAGETDHVIRCKLLWFWFMAVIWTPIVSRLQNLIPPNRISS